jgi:hypothetical protein
LQIYVHATLSNGCVVHASVIGTSTRWKLKNCDVINFLVGSSLGRKRDNSTKSRVRKEVHPGNDFLLHSLHSHTDYGDFCGCLTTLTNLFAILKMVDFFGMRWLRTSPQNLPKYPRWGEESSKGNWHARL